MSRLGNVYKDEVREVIRLEKRIERRLPVKGFVGMLLCFSLVIVAAMTLVALSIGGSVSIDKERMGVTGGATFHVALPVENVTRVVDIVLPTDSSHPPNVEGSSTTTSTIETTTTLKQVRIYGTFHDGTLYWRDPVTGVGSAPSGNDKGACGR